MDINLIRTFLEIQRTRHFGRAAENLFLTQAAVSARIRQLEGQLKVMLFERRRKDIQLTPAGRRFLPHAEALVQAWNRACQETALVEGQGGFLALGASPALWDAGLVRWLERASRIHSDSILSLDADGNDVLLRRLLDGDLDLVLVFEAPALEELVVRQAVGLDLVLVTSQRGIGLQQALAQGYVMVDWGPVFALNHGRHFPQAPLPRIRVGAARIALEWLLQRGGAAYLAYEMVAPLLAQGRLWQVAQAPVMERQALAVFDPANNRLPLIEGFLDSLRDGNWPANATGSGP
ncbi:MAG: LysR family transcriptional regulator [Candidatus Competibacteraceae bacterium]|nr:LysR family transcriptional regulator [Candidatus Competibacteraceae bacterium]